jgi:hypothetical protein
LTDDLKLKIESTWIEKDFDGFDRVIIFNVETNDFISPVSLNKTSRDSIRARVEAKLTSEIGLVHGDDYVYDSYDAVATSDRIATMFTPEEKSTKVSLKIQTEEHFTMLKLHYAGN